MPQLRIFLGDTPLATVLEAKVAEYGPDIVAAVESGGFLDVSAAVWGKDIEVIVAAFKDTGIVDKVTQVLADTVADPAIQGAVQDVSAQVADTTLAGTWGTLTAMYRAESARGAAQDVENLRKIGVDTYSWFRAGGMLGYDVLFGSQGVDLTNPLVP